MPDTSPFRLDEKIAAVVGAGSGIGAAVAAGAAAHGATVVCLDINDDAAAGVAHRIGTAASSAALDIRAGASVVAAFNRIVQQHGRLDCVVCTPRINVRSD